MGFYLYLGQSQDTTSGLGHIPSEPSIGQVLIPTSGWFFLDPYLSLSLDVHSSLSPENGSGFAWLPTPSQSWIAVVQPEASARALWSSLRHLLEPSGLV